MISFRNMALIGSGLTFGSIGLLAIVIPHTVASAYALSPLGNDGMNELRAVYSGFWIGLAVLYFRSVRSAELAKIAGLFLLLQASGRVLSLAVDGIPSAHFLAALVLEMIAGTIVCFSSPTPR
jgi:hypothetical protein